MTMVACGRMQWPRPIISTNTVGNITGAATGLTLDSTTDAVAWVGESPVTDTLTKVYFRTGTVTTGATVDVRIETVADGQPTGTLFGTNTNIGVVVADGDDNVWKTATLTAAASLTAGDEFAIVIISSAGTPNLQILAAPGNYSNGGMTMQPSVWQNATGAYARIDTNPMWCVEFSGGVAELPRLLPQNGSITITAFNSGSSPDEYALRFVPPFKMRCIGARVFSGNYAAGSAVTISLWPASSSVDGDALGQSVFDGDATGSTTNDGYIEMLWAAGVTLTAGTEYYVGMRGDNANNASVYIVDAAGTGAATNGIKGFTGNTAASYLATRTWTAGTAGSWSPTTTSRPIIELLFDQVDDGGAVGGNANILGGSVIQ